MTHPALARCSGSGLFPPLFLSYIQSFVQLVQDLPAAVHGMVLQYRDKVMQGDVYLLPLPTPLGAWSPY